MNASVFCMENFGVIFLPWADKITIYGKNAIDRHNILCYYSTRAADVST